MSYKTGDRVVIRIPSYEYPIGHRSGFVSGSEVQGVVVEVREEGSYLVKIRNAYFLMTGTSIIRKQSKLEKAL